jgi:hypothetical protein
MATSNPWINEIARINSVIQQTLRNIARDQALLAENPNRPDATTLREQIASGERYLIDLRAQLAVFTTEYNNFGKDSTASSGQVVAEEAQARADRAVTANPSGGPVPLVSANTAATTPGSQADRVNQNLEFGLDGRLRPQTQTQATPPAGSGAPLPFVTGDDDGNPVPGISNSQPGTTFNVPTPTTQAGAAANRDDNTAPNSNRTAQLINTSFNQRIVPEPNVLDEYASYTYAITWYLITPNQYNEMVRSQKKNCASWQLLMQSGGAPTQAAGATANSAATAGRNQFFSLDYYIDDLEIDSLIPLGGTGAANTATDIKFKVTEPNGITLIDNLYRAVSTLYKEKNVSKTANYPMAQYCLAVRFYGYNESGELVTTGRRGTNGATNLTDPRAIVEKFYPFVITNIKFRIPKDRVVEYEVTGKPIPHFYNKSQDRGTIPFAFELTGETVDQVLRGKPVGTVYPTSSGERRDSPQPNTSAPTQPSVAPVGAEISPIDDPVAFAATSGLGE